MYRILVADGMNNDQIENLRNLGFDVIDKFYDGEELGLMCQDVDALVIRSKNTITKEIIDKALEGNARLKIIIRINQFHLMKQEDQCKKLLRLVIMIK